MQRDFHCQMSRGFGGNLFGARVCCKISLVTNAYAYRKSCVCDDNWCVTGHVTQGLRLFMRFHYVRITVGISNYIIRRRIFAT